MKFKLIVALVALVVVLVIGGGGLFFRWLDHNDVRNTATQQARIEYRCVDVRLKQQHRRYVELNVCGIVRWYHCQRKILDDYRCSEVKAKR